MGRLEVTKAMNGSKLSLMLKGQIDEDTKFELYNISTCTELEIDLNGISQINSCGIREWIKWIGTAQNAVNIQLKQCPKIVVDQINMVDGFLPKNGKVMSFYVPYYSEDSGAEKNVLFTYGKEYSDGDIKAPTNIKGSDGSEMEMDIIPTKYFKFLKK